MKAKFVLSRFERGAKDDMEQPIRFGKGTGYNSNKGVCLVYVKGDDVISAKIVTAIKRMCDESASR